MTESKRNLIQGLFEEYDIQTADDIQDALKDLLSGTIREMIFRRFPQSTRRVLYNTLSIMIYTVCAGFCPFWRSVLWSFSSPPAARGGRNCPRAARG